jgi:hypothetical protein
MKERESLENIRSTAFALIGIQSLFLFGAVVKILTDHDHVTEKFIWILLIAGILPMLSIYRKAVKGLKN